MSDFDFSLYDPEDKTSISVKERPKKEKKDKSAESAFDFADYDYSDISRTNPPATKKEPSFFGDMSDYAKTIFKGGIEGISRLGRSFGPLVTHPSEDVFKQQTEALNKFIPVEEDFPQRAIRRGLQEIPTVIASPGGTAKTTAAVLASSFVGEGAKKLGAPEWAQSALEITTLLGPAVTKKLLSTGKDADLIKAAKQLGLSDDQITPLIQSNFKQKWLSKLVSRGESTKQKLSSTKEGISKAYEMVKKSPTAAQEIGNKNSFLLKKQFRDIFADMPSKASDEIKKDYHKLLDHPITGESLMTFYRNINATLSPKNPFVSRLKAPIKKSLHALSPELGQEFDTVNKLYTKYYPIASKLKPTLASQLISAGESLGALGAIVTLNLPFFATIAGEQGAKKIMQQLLFNPRLQQLGKKATIALNEGKVAIAKKTADAIAGHLKKASPEFAEKIKEVSNEDLESLYINQ